jgi:hypothetical protein
MEACGTILEHIGKWMLLDIGKSWKILVVKMDSVWQMYD